MYMYRWSKCALLTLSGSDSQALTLRLSLSGSDSQALTLRLGLSLSGSEARLRGQAQPSPPIIFFPFFLLVYFYFACMYVSLYVLM